MTQPTVDVEVTSDLIDLTGVPFAAVLDLDGQDVAPVMRRLLSRADDPESITSGYNPQRLD